MLLSLSRSAYITCILDHEIERLKRKARAGRRVKAINCGGIDGARRDGPQTLAGQ